MPIRTYQKETAAAKVIPVNDRIDESNITIQNKTGASITITVSLENDNYQTPLEGTLTIANNAIGALSNRYGFLLATGTGTGDIIIAEGNT